MSARPSIRMRRSGNMLDISCVDYPGFPSEVKSYLETELTYEQRRFLRGREAREARSHGLPPVEIVPVRCYRYDREGRFVCGAGFIPRLRAGLKKIGYASQAVRADLDTHDPARYTEDWDGLMEHFAGRYRPRQDEAVAAIAGHDCGIIHAPTGFGKTLLIASTGLLYPDATMDVVVQGKDLVQKTAAELSHYLPRVGRVWGGCKERGRVTVYSADSLRHADGKSDFLLADEVHRLGAPSYAQALARYQSSRNFGFTATWGCRFDGADMDLEALFGPVIFHMPYQEAVQHNMVVQLRVEWLDVRMDENPCGDRKGIWRETFGIWRNPVRNRILAERALSYPDDVQVLVMVRTLEHALYLRKFLPGWSLCHSEQAIKAEDLQQYRSRGLLSDDEGPMTTTRREQMRKDFESGALKKAICTGVWSTGVNFVGLGVLVRGDAMVSEIADTQIPGRACRTNGPNKDVGIIIDCVDQFDEGFRRKALTRRRHYEAHGWDQVWPGRASRTGA